MAFAQFFLREQTPAQQILFSHHPQPSRSDSKLFTLLFSNVSGMDTICLGHSLIYARTHHGIICCGFFYTHLSIRKPVLLVLEIH